MQLNADLMEQISLDAARQLPGVLERDGAQFLEIDNAAGLDELLDLMPGKLGFSEAHLYRRLRAFGPGVAPVIAQWFRSYVSHHTGADRARLQERNITALCRCEASGGAALLQCWDDVDEYGRSLACV